MSFILLSPQPPPVNKILDDRSIVQNKSCFETVVASSSCACAAYIVCNRKSYVRVKYYCIYIRVMSIYIYIIRACVGLPLPRPRPKRVCNDNGLKAALKRKTILACRWRIFYFQMMHYICNIKEVYYIPASVILFCLLPFFLLFFIRRIFSLPCGPAGSTFFTSSLFVVSLYQTELL